MQKDTQTEAGLTSALTQELDNLRGELKVLLAEECELRKQIIEKELNLCKINFGVYVGCIVRSKGGVNFKVAEINCFLDGKPSLTGYKQKKDGNYGIVAIYICSGWELVV